MTTETTHLPFLVDVKDLALVWNVTTTHINRLIATGHFPIATCQLSDRIVRCKRVDVEEYFNAPLSEVMPWLISEKEPA